MADKRNLKYSIKRLGRVKTWQLFVLLIFVGFIAATFLRLNNNSMVARREAVRQADKTGDAEALKNNLYSLQRNAAEHMNAGSDRIYLEHTYNRDAQRALQAAQAAASKGNDVLAKADEACRRQFSGWSQSYVHCVAAEQAKYPAASTATQFVPPNPTLYRHEFVSPFWSPDFAGFSIVVFLFITLVIVGRAIGFLILKILLKRHYSSI